MSLITENFSLKSYNTFGIDIRARYFVSLMTIKEVEEFLKNNPLSGNPFLILGGGSNILFTKDFPGLVLHPDIKGIEILNETVDFVRLKVGAAENWDAFVKYCINRNYGGIENLSLIPGTVGSSPIQNIGAYGAEVKNSIESVLALDMENSKERIFNNTECQFEYRDSIFKREYKNKYLITYVIFNLSKRPVLVTNYGKIREELEKFNKIDISAIRQVVIRLRNKKLPDPKELGNAGSFFKNPIVEKTITNDIRKQFPGLPTNPISNTYEKIPAAWLIEKCNWKGKRIGDAGIYKHHSLVLVNHGKASGQEVLELAKKIRDSVVKKFGIKLEMEVTVI
jgi:UDP-N-acetylmuramate dehydrogenase